MKVISMYLGLALLAATIPGPLGAAELQPATLSAWDAYIRTADSLIEARLDGQRPFLWTDEVAERVSRLQRGEIVIAPVSKHGMQTIPNGIIHDWIGATFIPNATLARLMAVVHDYERYKEFFRPVVTESEVIACSPTDQLFTMRWQHKVLFVNAGIQGQYQAHDVAVDARRGYNIANTTRVQEIENYGQSSQRLLPPGQGNGFIWRLHSIAKYEQRDGGVYLELQAIALTRDIPASLHWLVNPVVKSISINSLTTTLRQTRDAVNSLAERPGRLASCPIPSRGFGNASALRAH